MNDKAVKAAKKVLPVYQTTLDAWEAGVRSGDSVQVSCQKGCTGCCYQLVKATLAEGAAIAAHLLESGTYSKFQPRLEEVTVIADECEKDEDPSFKYFKTKTPCAFLVDGECAVYTARPAGCRSYFVTSDPSNCSPNKPGAEIAQVDPSAAMSVFVTKLLEATSTHIPSFIGPLSSVVMAGKELLERSPGSFKRWASKSMLFTEAQERSAAEAAGP